MLYTHNKVQQVCWAHHHLAERTLPGRPLLGGLTMPNSRGGLPTKAVIILPHEGMQLASSSIQTVAAADAAVPPAH